MVEQGRKVIRMVPAGKVTPGDRLFTVLSYANAGAKPAGDVVLVNPVPKQMEFVSAEGAALVSVDGGKSYGQLARLQVTGADGKARPALAADVTHVRWNLAPIAAGTAGQVSFQARLR